jgi:membrane associated rhomboid family serine protease
MSTSSFPATRTTTTRYAETWVQKVALAFGIVFLLVGIAGFVPGLTSDVGSMTFACHESVAKLLGVFQVSVLHNLVHALYGVVGIICARSARAARTYLIVGGIVYAVLWIYGLVFMDDMNANFVPLNSADNWLHLGLAVGMIALGLLVPARTDRTIEDAPASRPGAAR